MVLDINLPGGDALYQAPEHDGAMTPIVAVSADVQPSTRAVRELTPSS
jgi:hypothetical protein